MIVKMCERVRGGLEGVGYARGGKNRGGTVVHAHARGGGTRAWKHARNKHIYTRARAHTHT